MYVKKLQCTPQNISKYTGVDLLSIVCLIHSPSLHQPLPGHKLTIQPILVVIQCGMLVSKVELNVGNLTHSAIKLVG